MTTFPLQFKRTLEAKIGTNVEYATGSVSGRNRDR